MKTKNKVNLVFENFLERDPSQKFYLSRPNIEDVFTKNSYKFSPKQFNVLFSALETNYQKEFNYK